MQLLDGKLVSQNILSKLKLKIENWKLEINLDIILVGDNPASLKYVEMKTKKAAEIGVGGQVHRLSDQVSQTDLLALIQKLNRHPDVTGFFIQLPLPSHLDKQLILPSIDSAKDVDGLNPASAVTPAVVVGIIKLLAAYGITFSGHHLVVVNDSQLIGQPLKQQVELRGGMVTLCNDQTLDLAGVTSRADILISATGVKNLITANYVKEGSVVVDVGGGDVDFDHVSPKCSFITPTYGGVGPMTVASLFDNLINLSNNQVK